MCCFFIGVVQLLCIVTMGRRQRVPKSLKRGGLFCRLFVREVVSLALRQNILRWNRTIRSAPGHAGRNTRTPTPTPPHRKRSERAQPEREIVFTPAMAAAPPAGAAIEVPPNPLPPPRLSSGSVGSGTSVGEWARRLNVDEETLRSRDGMERWMLEGGLQDYTKARKKRRAYPRNKRTKPGKHF